MDFNHLHYSGDVNDSKTDLKVAKGSFTCTFTNTNTNMHVRYSTSNVHIIIHLEKGLFFFILWVFFSCMLPSPRYVGKENPKILWKQKYNAESENGMVSWVSAFITGLSVHLALLTQMRLEIERRTSIGSTNCMCIDTQMGTRSKLQIQIAWHNENLDRLNLDCMNLKLLYHGFQKSQDNEL